MLFTSVTSVKCVGIVLFAVWKTAHTMTNKIGKKNFAHVELSECCIKQLLSGFLGLHVAARRTLWMSEDSVEVRGKIIFTCKPRYRLIIV